MWLQWQGYTQLEVPLGSIYFQVHSVVVGRIQFLVDCWLEASLRPLPDVDLFIGQLPTWELASIRVSK